MFSVKRFFSGRVNKEKDSGMANFIKYENSPVYLGTQEGQVPATGIAGINNLIAANTCELSFDTQMEPQKFLGRQNISDDYAISGPKQAKISFSYTPLVGPNAVSGIQEASLLPLSLTGDFVSGHVVRIGNFLLQKCYLDSIGIQISAYNTVKFNVQMTSYDSSTIENDVYSGIGNSGSFVNSSLSGTYLSALHSLSLGVSGNSLSLPESKTEINIQTTCARTPVYSVGSINPDTVILNSVERAVSINGENVGRIINFSGANASLSLRFSEFASLVTGVNFNPLTDYRFGLDITGKITSQNLSMQPGRTLEGSINFRSNVF